MISYFANPPLPVATAVSPTWNSILTIICLILLSQFLATIIFKLLDNEYQIHKKALRMHHLFSYHLYHANHNPSLKYYLEYLIQQELRLLILKYYHVFRRHSALTYLLNPHNHESYHLIL